MFDHLMCGGWITITGLTCVTSGPSLHVSYTLILDCEIFFNRGLIQFSGLCYCNEEPSQEGHRIKSVCVVSSLYDEIFGCN